MAYRSILPQIPPRVSAALIARNEEQTLGRCLDSIKGSVDEIVVVDTGSTDATKAVARRYTDRVFEFAWRQDFAAARQFAFDKASGDWVCWLDADDVVRGAEHIRPLAAGAPQHVGGFSWRYICDRDAHGNVRCEHWRERLVRNDGGFRWSGRIHEVLVAQRPAPLIQAGEVVVEHFPDRARGAEKLGRNLAILEQEYAASGDAPPARLLFYLGREYAGAGAYDKAIDFLTRYLDVSTWDEERYLAQVEIADLHRALGQHDLALNADLQALKICPHWPTAYFGLARTYYFLRDWHKVIHWIEVGRAMPEPQTILIANPMEYRYNWIIYYTNALYYVGAVQEAQDWTRRALQLCPDDAYHRENADFFAREIRQ